ncbi:MAG: type VI secretion protein IcmF/TssM N-terminal domain-containing protein [Aliidongia sp.]
MGNLQYLAAMLLNRWTTGFAGVAIAGSIVWYLGPFVPGLSGALPRALVILGFVLIWSVVNGGLTWRRRRRETALVDGATKESADSPRDRRADTGAEVGRLRARMKDALARLRASGTRGYLYEQPWFVLIGPPGAGKTTALLNSGLSFPLSQADGSDTVVGGVGRDAAVRLVVRRRGRADRHGRGRYTTQDSDAAVDQAGWTGFLDLLRRTRPRQAINGVITVISLTDIAAADPAERAAHARAVRRRVTEISERLRLRIPVYAVFSKADRPDPASTPISTIWMPKPAARSGARPFRCRRASRRFSAEFQLLLDRLDERLIDRLQSERTTDRRALIAGFPLQVASLKQPLEEFLTQAFGGTKLDPAPFLRGVYVTSATQEGTPIDRLTGVLARSFGVDQKRIESLQPSAGRSYFLKRLLAEVVLGEALLVVNGSAKLRRRRWLRAGGYAGVPRRR